MKRMKKFLACVLTLSLVLGVFNAPIFSKAETEYINVTLTGTDGWSTGVNGDNWVLYLTTSGYESADWSYKYEGLTYLYNGKVGTTTQVSSADGSRLYCTIPTSEVPATDGTTFTIIAGKYAPDDAGTTQGLNILNDLDIAVVDGRLVGTEVLKPVIVDPFNSTNESFYFSLKYVNNDTIRTNVESWVNFLSPSYCDGTRIDTAGWTTTYSGVLIDGQPMDYWGAHFKNTGAGEFYIDGLNAVAGTEIVVKGHFVSSTQADWTMVGNFFLPELKFTYDGSAWKFTGSLDTIDYTGTPEYAFGNANTPIAGFYFTAGETAFPYNTGWGYNSFAEDSSESGVFLNGNKTAVFLKKVDKDLWYVCMSDASVEPAKDDIITVKGAFYYENHKITFTESKFTWDGTAYKEYVEAKEYIGTPVLSETEEYGKAAGFYFTSEDEAPYAEDWSLTYTAADSEEYGVFVNGTKSAITLKKVNTNLWYVCIGDAGVTLSEGDVIKIKGQFQYGSETVTFNEASFEFNGRCFGEGTFTATDFTITGLAYGDIKYDEANSRWNMYFTLSTNIPGDVDATYFPYMAYDIDGTEYTTHWFKSSSAKTVDGEVIYNLYVPIEELPQTLGKEYVITLKAGASQGRVSGTNVALADGIKLTADYQFVVGGDYEASAPAVDYTTANGGNENGIYLSSGDAFPTIGWDYNLTKTGENSGVYVNDATTEVFIKKYDDNKYYVCLSDIGITAGEGTIVMLKGSFTTAGLNTVTFKTAKYIYTGGQWKVYTPVTVTETLTKYGDATRDDDETVNSQDLVRIKRCLANEVDYISVVNADLNSSGNIDEHDAALERWLLVNGWDYFSYGSRLDGVPTYEDNQEMRLAAFVAPEYNADTIAQDLKEYADAEFTTIIGEKRVMYGDANLDAYMKAAQDAGLDVLVQSGNITNMAKGEIGFEQDKIKEEFDKLLTYDNFRGLFIGDEPTISQWESYTQVMNILNSLNAELGKDMFVANHPLYTDESNLSNDSSLSLSEKYTNYANAYGSLFGEFMYDYYPFRYGVESTEFFGLIKNYGNIMREDWFNNLTIAATISKGKVPAGITVQSYAENMNSKDHYRSVTEADISFQVYSALAYGMKSISYFTYGEHWDDSVGTTDCMIYNGQKTGIYTAVQAVNTEIKKIDHMMLNFNWQGTIGFSGDNSDSIMDYVADYTSLRIDMAKTSATNDTIIGCLKDLNGYDGFMLVNATDPSDNKSTTVNVTFNDADHAKVYIDGVESDVALTDGAYNVTLAPGQGIFVIPYIAE